MNTRCAAFKIGTESAGDFSSIRVGDCRVVEANLGAIKILSVDGAHISGVLVERIQVADADTPVFLRLGARGRTFRKGDAARPPGSIAGVTIRDLTVDRARRVGILISGLPGHSIDHVSLDRISIAMSGTPPAQVPPDPPENPATYPEVRMFGEHLPSYGLYARHVRDLRIAHVTIAAIAGDPRLQRIVSDDRP